MRSEVEDFAASGCWASGLSLVLILQAAPLFGQPPTFRSQTELVRVDVRVSRDGQAVPNLTAEDFEILDNGVRQEVSVARNATLPLGLVLALDVSGSVQGERFERLQRSVHELLGDLGQDDRVTLLTFAETLTIAGRQGAQAASMAASLPAPSANSLTGLRDAAYAALLLAEELDTRPLVVVFSDGFDTASWLSPGQVLETARRRKAVVYAVTTGPTAPFLGRLAATTGGRVLAANWDQSLSSAFRAVLGDFRARYLLGYAPTGVPQAGWHTILVRAKNPRFTVEAREGYFR